MTSLTITTHPAGHPTRPAPRRVALVRTIRSEFTTVRSVRSTYWTLFVLVLASIAWCVAYCLGTSALFVEACGLFAFGIGALVRNTAGALTLAFGCLALVPELIRALPAFLHNDLIRWVPGGDAINSMTATIGGQIPHTFSAWGELAVFAGYAAILLAAGAVLFSRRDA